MEIITTTERGLVLEIPFRVWWDRLLGLVRFSRRKELTEEDVLKIVEEGRKEYREGKTEPFRTFIEREYPQYAHYFNQKS